MIDDDFHDAIYNNDIVRVRDYLLNNSDINISIDDNLNFFILLRSEQTDISLIDAFTNHPKFEPLNIARTKDIILYPNLNVKFISKLIEDRIIDLDVLNRTDFKKPINFHNSYDILTYLIINHIDELDQEELNAFFTLSYTSSKFTSELREIYSIALQSPFMVRNISDKYSSSFVNYFKDAMIEHYNDLHKTIEANNSKKPTKESYTKLLDYKQYKEALESIFDLEVLNPKKTIISY